MKPGDRVSYITMWGTFEGELLEYQEKPVAATLFNGKQIQDGFLCKATVIGADGKVTTLEAKDTVFAHYNLRVIEEGAGS